MNRLPVILFMVLGFVVPPAIAFDHEHEHQHGAAATQQLQLDHGKKWTTDAPLRRGMEQIRALVASEVHPGKPNPTLAGKINEQLAFIVQSCKLAKEADAMLHLVLADIMEGNEALEGKHQTLKPADGVAKIGYALDNYATYFEHPGWQPSHTH